MACYSLFLPQLSNPLLTLHWLDIYSHSISWPENICYETVSFQYFSIFGQGTIARCTFSSSGFELPASYRTRAGPCIFVVPILLTFFSNFSAQAVKSFCMTFWTFACSHLPQCTMVCCTPHLPLMSRYTNQNITFNFIVALQHTSVTHSLAFGSMGRLLFGEGCMNFQATFIDDEQFMCLVLSTGKN